MYVLIVIFFLGSGDFYTEAYSFKSLDTCRITANKLADLHDKEPKKFGHMSIDCALLEKGE